MTPAELIEGARDWLGVPFKHQGRSRYGVDCIGLVICTLREADALPAGFVDAPNYGRRPGKRLRDSLAQWCRPGAIGEPGTLALIRWPGVADGSHIALCTGPTLIHAYRDGDGVVEHGYRGAWCRRTESAWRVPGVEYE